MIMNLFRLRNGNLSNTSGASNTANGAVALLFNTDGSGNTAIGANALESNTHGDSNTAVGFSALMNNTETGGNTAIGWNALSHNAMGGANTATGSRALLNNTAGSANTANGEGALLTNDTGSDNTAVGSAALLSNAAGLRNTAVGSSALVASTGSDNTAVGFSALGTNTAGQNNTAVGRNALASSSGSGNTALGAAAGSSISTASNVICIGATGENLSNSCYIGNIFNATSGGGSTVFINATGKLGTSTSSRRFKEEIKPMDQASEALFALKPVSFRYKKEVDLASTSQFGLVAEDVEKVNPDLVVRDKEGKAYSVRYDQVNAMLLNEFLKEHRTVQELKSNAAKQEATIARQQKQIEALTAGLEQVSAQLELSKPAPQVVNNQ
jgi:hypothetical protein